MLSYREIAPPPRLAPFLRCFWTLNGEHDGSAERLLPDGSFELVFHRGEAFASEGEQQPAAMLMGEIRRPIVVRPNGRADIVGVRFRPGGAAPFFAHPMDEVRDRVLSLELLLRQAPVAADADIASISSFLERRLAPPRHHELVRAAVCEIERECGDVRIRELTRRMGVTERTLERAFSAIVGIGPKQMCRVARFQASLGDEIGLAYFDQSHRIHEFRELSGVTPTEFWRERHSIYDAFVGNLQS